jgi:hypothetical protein
MTTFIISTAVVCAGALLSVFAPHFCADFALALLACV